MRELFYCCTSILRSDHRFFINVDQDTMHVARVFVGRKEATLLGWYMHAPCVVARHSGKRRGKPSSPVHSPAVLTHSPTTPHPSPAAPPWWCCPHDTNQRQLERLRFLDQAAEGTASGRGWNSTLPLAEGVFVSTRPGLGPVGVGGGILVSPTRDQRGDETSTTRPPTDSSDAGNGSRTSGDVGGLLPRFSPVDEQFGRKPLW